MRYVLVGNQNCGKTTLFNVLTGSNQHVGNFPGVTVEQKSGIIKGGKGDEVVDLPGIYSIRPYTQEETVTINYIIDSRPDGIINIVDATNIERNLYLTLQLLELHIPTVIALNMMDEVEGNGGAVNVKQLSEDLGVPVIPVAAISGQGVSELIRVTRETAGKRILPKVMDFCPEGPVHRCIHSVAHIIEDHAQMIGISARFVATKLIEGDNTFADRLGLDVNEEELIEHSIIQMEHETDFDRNEALADMRYSFIEKITAKSVKKPVDSIEHRRSENIDKIVTGKWTAIPVFIIIMCLVFFLTFNVIGQPLSDLMRAGINGVIGFIDIGLTNYGINPVVKSLVVDGICAGVGSVLSFLPLVMTLFFFLSILEDTGYMARVAFFMDKLLRKIGLSGKSFVPMIIGFGCTVPAVMATRTLSSERDRKMTIMLVPFMSCSAKIPIYAVFASAFFKGKAALVMAVLYFTGILVGILAALLYDKTIFKGKPVPFVMELPNYRLPSLKSAGLLLWEKAKDFIERAFTVIFLGTIVIWFLQHFDAKLNIVTDSADSLLALLGNVIAPIFKLNGFDDWRATTALIPGFTAKEAIVSTLAVLYQTSEAELPAILASVFTPLAAASYLVFTLLYTPCMAAVATIKKELNSHLGAIGIVIIQCVIAWIVSVLVYQIGILL